MDVTPHCLSFLRQRSLGRRSGPWGLQSVCFFSLGLSKGENRFRSESFVLQIHWEVRGQGSGFQQQRFSQVWCSVSPGSSERLDGVRHVAFSRQTQVRILQTQCKMYRRESPNSWCNTTRRICQAAHIPNLLENMRANAGRASCNQQQRCSSDIIRAVRECRKTRSRLSFGFLFIQVWRLTWVTAVVGYQSSELLFHFKVFSAPYGSPAGASSPFLRSFSLGL